MSRAGANPNWEYQLISHEGHTSDKGLRQRAMVLRGHVGASRGPWRDRPQVKQKKRFNLTKIFGGKS